ncbi:MAG: TIGR00730 family Rossman fold protein [Kordiimonas sp.]
MSSNIIKSVCVYCGSRLGNKPYYEELATEVGKKLAKHDMNLVYGAGSVGLMGVVARSATEAGAKVIGIIPEHLDAIEITQTGLDELHVTDNMHERKKMMFDRSDAFIVLPGGLGTLDETMEMMTWAQLSLHKKPIILINYRDFWSPLIELIKHVTDDGFASQEHADLLTVVESADEALDILSAVGRN